MSKKVIILAVVAGLGILGGIFGLYQFNKKVPSLSTITPDFVLTADELFDAFDSDETSALQKYEGKVITVTGTVMSSRATDTTTTLILDANNAMAGGVNCSFASSSLNVEEGQIIAVKGRCQGFLMNVVLNNCIIADEH